LPCHLLSVHVDFEVGRIEIQDRRILADHQLLVRLWQMLLTVAIDGRQPEWSARLSSTVENDVAHLAAGKTPINCSNGLKGRPIVNAMS
jgi:hypothetical protein